MCPEASVPIEQRVLVLEGKLDSRAFESVRAGLPPAARPDECFFARYTYADLPLPRTFAVVFDLADPVRMEPLAITVLAATQEFAKPHDVLPHGWKTVVWLDAPARNSALLSAQPPVSDWFQRQTGLVGLSSRETWEAVKAHAPARMASPAVPPPKPFPWRLAAWAFVSGVPTVLLGLVYLGWLGDRLFGSGHRDSYGVMAQAFVIIVLSPLCALTGGIALAVTGRKVFLVPLVAGLLSGAFWVSWFVYVLNTASTTR